MKDENNRQSKMIEYNGETHTFEEWSEITDINVKTLTTRYYRGDRGDRLFRKVGNSSGSTNIEYNGETHNLAEWSRITGINERTLNDRYHRGKRGGELFIPVGSSNQSKMIEYNGETHTFEEWSEITGLKENTIRNRYYRGDRGDELFRSVSVRRYHGESGGGHSSGRRRLYGIWLGMKQRCSDPNFKKYSYYGGKGIRVCDEWIDDYVNFRDWAMSNGYKDDLTIDRIDNDGNYEPGNCRWATWQEQAENRTSSQCIMIEHDGQTRSMSEWSRITGIHRKTLSYRYHEGDRGTDLFRPIRKYTIKK